MRSHHLRVMVLEGDDGLRERVLMPGLTALGFHVAGARSTAELYRRMLSRQFDIALLDNDLPDEDSSIVAHHLRSLSSMGIVMLADHAQDADQVHALTMGADLFLSKSVDMKVLAANLHSLSRRLHAKRRNVPRRANSTRRPVGRWHLDNDGWCLVCADQGMLTLSASERCVIQRLFAAQGTPVSRDDLIATLADDIYAFDPHRLDMLIYRLRRKCSDQIGATLPLMTARGAGYLFVAEGDASNDLVLPG